MHIVRTMVKIGLVIVLLVVLFGGAGAAYTWYNGRHPTKISTEPVPEAAPKDTVIKPSKPAPDAVESAAITVLTSPVPPGSNASVTIKTNAGSTCTITVTYKDVASTDSGLVAKKADDFGNVSWTWTVEDTVPLGTWPVKIICVYNGRSAMVQGDLKVAKP